MANPVTGYDGLCQIGAAASEVTINKVRKWSFKSERDVEEFGPWVGDSNKVDVVGGKKGTLEVECDVPKGGDPGQQDVIDAYEANTNVRLVFTAEDGYAITFATPSYTAAELEVDAKGTQTFKFTATGTYAITQDL